MKSINILCILIITAIALSSCSSPDTGKSFQKIAVEDVSEIIVQNTNPSSKRTLTKDEISTFVSYYNNSRYDGKATGEGGTADFGATVKLVNNDIVLINQFISVNRFEVTYINKSSYYINSPELYQFLYNIANQSKQ